MKIALVNNSHPFSGMGKYAFNLLNSYMRQKKSVEMFYLETPDNKIKSLNGVNKIQRNLGSIELNKTLLPYFIFPKKIPEGYNVYHATNQFLARLALYKPRCVITHHDIRPIILSHDLKMWMVGRVLRYLLKSYKKAHKIIAIADVIKEDLLKLKIIPEEKITIVYHGYDKGLYKPMSKKSARKKLGLPQDIKILLNVGAEEPIKNIPLLLEATRIIQKVEKVLLVRVGGGITSGGYWKTSESLKTGIDIKEFKNVSEKDMPLIYNAADVFIAPYTYDEGFMFPPLESMACGVPTVLSNLKTFEQGSIRAPNDPQGLAEVVLKILNNSLLHRKLSRKALKMAERFSMETHLKNTYRVYEEVSKK